VLVLGLAAALALILVVAAGHHHDGSVATHECAVCAVWLDEVPCPDDLPAPVPSALAQSYVLAVAVAYVCLYRCPRLTPPICGPPPRRPATRRRHRSSTFLAPRGQRGPPIEN
jgi:hypothetical protein